MGLRLQIYSFVSKLIDTSSWTASSVLVYGIFAFLLALLTAYLIGIDINPVVLSEALPFLVITVGFEKPFVLARAVFSNPALTPINAPGMTRSRNASRSSLGGQPQAAPSGRVMANGHLGVANATAEHDEGYDSLAAGRAGVRWGQPVPAKDIVLAGFDRTGRQITRDYAIEIAVLLAGSFTGVPGLKEFCQLAALILCYDCLFLFGFFAAVLTVMVEVKNFSCSLSFGVNETMLHLGSTYPHNAWFTQSRFFSGSCEHSRRWDHSLRRRFGRERRR